MKRERERDEELDRWKDREREENLFVKANETQRDDSVRERCGETQRDII